MYSGARSAGETHSATAVAAASFIASLMHRARTLIAPRKIAGEARAYNPPREERQTSPPAASEVFGLKVHWPILLPTIRLNECNECDVVIVTQYPGAVFAWIATASS